MAKRNSMSTARRSRTRRQDSTPHSGSTAAIQSIGEPEPGRASHGSPAGAARIISGERNRLMKAHAVLGCVEFALLYEDWLDRSKRPSFADAVAAALDLIDECVDWLDPSFVTMELRLTAKAVNQAMESVSSRRVVFSR